MICMCTTNDKKKTGPFVMKWLIGSMENFETDGIYLRRLIVGLIADETLVTIPAPFD